MEVILGKIIAAPPVYIFSLIILIYVIVINMIDWIRHDDFGRLVTIIVLLFVAIIVGINLNEALQVFPLRGIRFKW